MNYSTKIKKIDASVLIEKHSGCHRAFLFFFCTIPPPFFRFYLTVHCWSNMGHTAYQDFKATYPEVDYV